MRSLICTNSTFLRQLSLIASLKGWEGQRMVSSHGRPSSFNCAIRPLYTHVFTAASSAIVAWGIAVQGVQPSNEIHRQWLSSGYEQLNAHIKTHNSEVCWSAIIDEADEHQLLLVSNIVHHRISCHPPSISFVNAQHLAFILFIH